jgi:sigma-B regulation protein RsbU (phosphoserine phosphatase)
MMVKSSLQGVLTVYNKRDGGQFTEEDQRLLAIIAAQSAQVVENARLYEEEQALHRMKEEVRLASKIQIDLLPKTSPKIAGYDVAGKSVPAQVVGGDYFDFIPMDENRWALCVGDVSGKGLPASLLMANLQATLRGQTLLNASAKVTLQRSNKLLHQSTSSEKFVTLFYGILDPQNHTFSFSNAGHDNPFLISLQQEPRRLSTGGLVLSIMEDFPYEEESIPLASGDTIVIYSDGITEAVNPHQEQFGDARIAAIVKEHPNSTSTELIEHIVNAVKAYSGTAPQMDDMTLLVIRRVAN